MINTVELKDQQLRTGFFKVGSGSEVILIQGSCRAVPYVTYLRDWNNINDNRFTIYYIDPFSNNWDINGNRTDYQKELIKLESNQQLLDMLKSVDIFVHEYYANAEMFNCDKNAFKNIYQFGLRPEIDICLPSFNDVFLLTRDIVSFDMAIKKQAIQDYNVIGKLSPQTLELIEKTRENNLQRFYDICSKTDFPEFADLFKNHYKQRRYFFTFNHTSKHFNQTLFWLMNAKFLKLDMKGYVISEVDLYANNFTTLSEYDEGYEWNEEVKPLRESL